MRRTLHTKEKRILIALIALVIAVTGIFVFNGYILTKKYEEQAVMAEKYLEAGEYEQAVAAYLKALSMKNSNQERLSIGLSEAYIGVNNYEKALEVLRNCYKKTGGIAIKEKIEEVSAKKTDYEFNQITSHADTYFTNGEYEKAIAEYEKAKLIKSKEPISFKRIAEAYIAIGNYSLARKEALEGLALTQSEELNKILSEVEKHLLDTQYTEMLNAASEYIYQENFEEGIRKLQEAIALLPREQSAYSRLAEVYLELGDYDLAVTLLEEALRSIESDVLKEILLRAENLRDEKQERNRILGELSLAVSNVDTEKILELMENTFFTMKIAGSEPVYYSAAGESVINNGNGMIIFDKDTIYTGGFQDGRKKGVGVYFIRRKDGSWCYYKGGWSNDLPNDMGITVEEQYITDKDGAVHTQRIVTEGSYLSGLENDSLRKVYYQDGIEKGRIEYLAKNGVPQELQEAEGTSVSSGNSDRYVIAEWYRNGKAAGEYYTVKKGTIWGFEPYITK